MVLFTLLEKANSLVLILYKIMKKLWKAFDQKKQRNKAVVESEQGNHLWVFFFFSIWLRGVLVVAGGLLSCSSQAA